MPSSTLSNNLKHTKNRAISCNHTLNHVELHVEQPPTSRRYTAASLRPVCCHGGQWGEHSTLTHETAFVLPHSRQRQTTSINKSRLHTKGMALASGCTPPPRHRRPP